MPASARSPPLHPDVDPTGVHIGMGVFRQPVLQAPNTLGLQVSVSHSGAIGAALAFAEGHPMALDVEQYDAERARVIESAFDGARSLSRGADAAAPPAGVYPALDDEGSLVQGAQMRLDQPPSTSSKWPPSSTPAPAPASPPASGISPSIERSPSHSLRTPAPSCCRGKAAASPLRPCRRPLPPAPRSARPMPFSELSPNEPTATNCPCCICLR
jgi:hypothetical protein